MLIFFILGYIFQLLYVKQTSFLTQNQKLHLLAFKLAL